MIFYFLPVEHFTPGDREIILSRMRKDEKKAETFVCKITSQITLRKMCLRRYPHAAYFQCALLVEGSTISDRK